MKVKVKGELKWVVWENILLRCIKNKGINLSLKNKLVVTLPTKLSQGYQTSESPQNKTMYVDEYYLKLMDIPDLLWLVIYKYNTQETDKECRFRAQELLLRSQSKTKIKRSFFTQKYLWTHSPGASKLPSMWQWQIEGTNSCFPIFWLVL